MDGQETTVIVAGLAAGGLNIVSQVAQRGRGEHLVRPIVGTFLAIGGLLLVAQWLPGLAAGVALVLLITSIVINGRPFLTVVQNVLGE